MPTTSSIQTGTTLTSSGARVDVLAARESSEVGLTSNAAAAGQLGFACHVSSHYQLGMRTPITVK